jgi:hypothetical protein
VSNVDGFLSGFHGESGDFVADLKTEGESLTRGSAKMTAAARPLEAPLKQFSAASHDLSAFGALGSLLKATGEIQHGMTQLSGVVSALGAEYEAEGRAMKDVGTVFGQVDAMLAGSSGRTDP